MRHTARWNQRGRRDLPKATVAAFWRGLDRLARCGGELAPISAPGLSVTYSSSVDPQLDDDLLAAGLHDSGLNLRAYRERARKAVSAVRLEDGSPASCAMLLEARWAGFAMGPWNGRVALLSTCTQRDLRGRGLAGEALAALGQQLLRLGEAGVDLDGVSVGADPRILAPARSRLPVAVVPCLNGGDDLPSHEVPWQAMEARAALRSAALTDAPEAEGRSPRLR